MRFHSSSVLITFLIPLLLARLRSPFCKSDAPTTGTLENAANAPSAIEDERKKRLFILNVNMIYVFRRQLDAVRRTTVTGLAKKKRSLIGNAFFGNLGPGLRMLVSTHAMPSSKLVSVECPAAGAC